VSKSALEETLLAQIRQAELPWEVMREYRFAREYGKQWRFDFAWPAVRIALEVDGGPGRRE
jgi:hypothetical protein